MNEVTKAAVLSQEWRGRGGRPVVKIDKNGKIVARYVSAEAAAKANYVTPKTIKVRCYGEVKREFALIGYSFRYEDQLPEGIRA